MKSFFSRRHDSTPTSHSKSAPREAYKFWTPNSDAEGEFTKPKPIHGDVPPTERPHVEKRSSSRAAKSSTIPMYEKYNIPNNYTASSSTEKPSYPASQPNQGTSASHLAQVHPQPPANKATSTRHGDYYDRPYPPPPSSSRPITSTRTHISYEAATKSSRHGNYRNESTAPVPHEIWIPTVAPSTSRQIEERRKDPSRVQDANETSQKYYTSQNEKNIVVESSKRDRERDRPKEKDRDRDRNRDKGRDGDREKVRHTRKVRDVDLDRERQRTHERDWDRERDRQRDRERAKEIQREQERVKERDREQERENEREIENERQRQKERERERDLASKEQERNKEREKENERERQRERERAKEIEKEQERREKEREKEKERELERERQRERERERERYYDRERKEREKQRLKEWDRDRERGKDRNIDPSKASNTRGREGVREDIPPLDGGNNILQQSDRAVVADDGRQDTKIQERSARREKDGRPSRDGHRTRDRERDIARYRAEVTDGEQDLRRLKHSPAFPDKRKESGWASDNYANQERKSSKTAGISLIVQNDDAENSDGSIGRKAGVRALQKRTRLDEGGKVPRSRQDKNEGTAFLPISMNPNTSNSGVQPPVLPTPQQTRVHIPPKDYKNNDGKQLSVTMNSATMLTNDSGDVPVRREINRLKLHNRNDDSSPQSVVPAQPILQSQGIPQPTISVSQTSLASQPPTLPQSSTSPVAPLQSTPYGQQVALSQSLSSRPIALSHSVGPTQPATSLQSTMSPSLMPLTESVVTTHSVTNSRSMAPLQPNKPPQPPVSSCLTAPLQTAASSHTILPPHLAASSQPIFPQHAAQSGPAEMARQIELTASTQGRPPSRTAGTTNHSVATQVPTERPQDQYFRRDHPSEYMHTEREASMDGQPLAAAKYDSQLSHQEPVSYQTSNMRMRQTQPPAPGVVDTKIQDDFFHRINSMTDGISNNDIFVSLAKVEYNSEEIKAKGVPHEVATPVQTARPPIITPAQSVSSPENRYLHTFKRENSTVTVPMVNKDLLETKAQVLEEKDDQPQSKPRQLSHSHEPSAPRVPDPQLPINSIANKNSLSNEYEDDSRQAPPGVITLGVENVGSIQSAVGAHELPGKRRPADTFNVIDRLPSQESTRIAYNHPNGSFVDPISNPTGISNPSPMHSADVLSRPWERQEVIGAPLSRPSTSTGFQSDPSGRAMRHQVPSIPSDAFQSHTIPIAHIPSTGSHRLNAQKVSGLQSSRVDVADAAGAFKQSKEDLVVVTGDSGLEVSDYKSTNPTPELSPAILIHATGRVVVPPSIIEPIASHSTTSKQDSMNIREPVARVASRDQGSAVQMPILPSPLPLHQSIAPSIMPLSPGIVDDIRLPSKLTKQDSHDSPQMQTDIRHHASIFKPLPAASVEVADHSPNVHSNFTQESPNLSVRKQVSNTPRTPTGPLKLDETSNPLVGIQSAAGTSVPQSKSHRPLASGAPATGQDNLVRPPNVSSLIVGIHNSHPRAPPPVAIPSRMESSEGVNTTYNYAEHILSQPQYTQPSTDNWSQQFQNSLQPTSRPTETRDHYNREENTENTSPHLRSASNSKPVGDDKIVEGNSPSLGFFTNTFSAALSTPTENTIQKNSPRKTNTAIEKFNPDLVSGRLHNSIRYTPSTKGNDMKPDRHEASSRIMRKGSAHLRPVPLVENAAIDDERTEPPPFFKEPVVETRPDSETPRPPSSQPQPKINHPVLAELLSSPTPKVSAAIHKEIVSLANPSDLNSRKTAFADVHADNIELDKPRYSPPERRAMEVSRPTPSERHPSAPPQRSFPEHIHSTAMGQESRTSSRLLNIQPTPSGSKGNERRPPELQTVSSSKTPSVFPSVHKQEMTLLMDTTTVPVAASHPVQEVMPSLDRKMSSTPATFQTQYTPSNRGIYEESGGSRPAPAPAGARPSNIAQIQPSMHIPNVPTSYSSRHQHSASVPASFATLSGTNGPSREELPRSATPAQSHYKMSSFQIASTSMNGLTSAAYLPRAPSEETILMTPSSLAQSLLLQPTVSRQSATVSVTSQTRKAGNFFNVFKKTHAVSEPPVHQYEIWHPSGASKTPESSPGHSKAKESQQEPKLASSTPPRRVPPPISVPAPVHSGMDRKTPHSDVFTPFRYLTSRRNRAVSVASVEAQDGTAPNTVVGSPTASMYSQAPLQPPPLRDPQQATEAWRNREEAVAKARARENLRRQRPGVVFDVDEEHPDETKRRPRRMKTRYRSSSKQTEAP